MTNPKIHKKREDTIIKLSMHVWAYCSTYLN